MDVEIPDKLYFRIGEVSELTGIKPHVLRYWEAEFKTFQPSKSRTRQRLYRRRDVELVLRLKSLLYEQGYTIAGARKKLREAAPLPEDGEGQLDLPLDREAERALLREIRGDLLKLRAALERDR